MEELLKRHIQETDKNFEDVYDSLVLITAKLDDLREFKTKLIVSSRFFSLVVSAVCGIITLLASSFVTYLINVKLNKG